MSLQVRCNTFTIKKRKLCVQLKKNVNKIAHLQFYLGFTTFEETWIETCITNMISIQQPT